MQKRKGNCYAAAEALYHILGGKRNGWRPMVMHLKGGDTHWYLQSNTGWILDPSRLQFPGRHHRPGKNYWMDGKGCGFLTKKPSKRARKLIKALTWREK